MVARAGKGVVEDSFSVLQPAMRAEWVKLYADDDPGEDAPPGQKAAERERVVETFCRRWREGTRGEEARNDLVA